MLKNTLDGWSTGGRLPPDNKDDRQVVAYSRSPGMAGKETEELWNEASN